MNERIPLVDPDDDDIDEHVRSLLQGMREVGGDYNVLRALANHSRLLEGFMSLSAVALERAQPVRTASFAAARSQRARRLDERISLDGSVCRKAQVQGDGVIVRCQTFLRVNGGREP